MFTHRYRYLFAFLLSLYTYINTEICKVYYYFNIRIDWYAAFASILLITFLIVEGNRHLEKWVRKKIPPEKNNKKFPIYFFIAGTILSTILTVFVVWFMGMVLHSFSIVESYTPLKLNLMYGTLVNLLFHLINTIIFYFKEYKITSLQAEQLKSITAEAELQLIKSQVNPHFLFNNLNVLSALILKDNKEANKFIEEFSKVYRYILSNHDKEVVELKTELDFIKPYIFLLEKRFAEGLVISVQVQENNLHQYIIPASLQMLIENAIKHNVVSRSKPLIIDVFIQGDNTIVVKNNIQAKQTKEVSTGIGLQNIIKRYKLVSNKEVQVQANEEIFSVSLPLLAIN